MLEGRLSASDVFDIDLLARYLIINKLWNAEHATILDNLRLYLNPVTMLIEPIGFDAVPLLDVRNPIAPPTQGSLFERIFQDANFRQTYFDTARRIGTEAQNETFLNWVKTREREYLKVLHLENPLIPHFLSNVIKRYASVIATFKESVQIDRKMEIAGVKFPQTAKAYLITESGGSYLEFQNIMPVAVNIIKISIIGKNGTQSPLLAQKNGVTLPIVLPGRVDGQVGQKAKIDLAGITISKDQKIIVSMRVEGNKYIFQETAINYSAPLVKPVLPQPLSVDQILSLHPFLQWNSASGGFQALPGDWTIEQDIVLPTGVGLSLPPATRWRFKPKRMLLARGPLNFNGTAEAPIVLQASDPKAGWGGVAVLGSDQPSHLRHVRFENMKGIEIGGWGLTGGVTFRKANVELSDVTFSDVDAEDALNIIRSDFTLQRSIFNSTRSDAFDADFSRGKIINGKFSNIGGDGIDISGSELEVDGTVLERINDKAFSIGEASHAVITNVTVTGVGTGVASKDGSNTVVEASRFTDTLHASLMSYNKKPVYGTASLIAKNIEFDSVGAQAVVQTGNTLSLNGKTIQPQTIDIDALYSEGYMRK